MTDFQRAIEVFPLELRQRLQQIPAERTAEVQEIRLRIGQPICFTGRGHSIFTSGVTVISSWLEEIIDNACEHSVYAHQEELRNGYITARGGYRIGIAGTAVMKEGTVSGFRNITSLCLRVAREHKGCATDILPLVYHKDSLHSLLIAGEPSCGKTSLLKDLLWQLARCDIYPAVVDERGELRQSALSVGCDVLSYISKTKGLEQAVRCLAPPLMILDELGDEDEIGAVIKGLYRGVPAVATVHCHEAHELLRRPALRTALEQGVFEQVVFLKGPTQPGTVKTVIKTEEWLREMAGDDAVDSCRHVGRCYRLVTTATTGERVAGNQKQGDSFNATAALHVSADGNTAS